MADHRGAYAQRFARVAIVRPPRPRTDAEWEAWVAGLDEFGQAMARFARTLAQLAGQRHTTEPRATSPRTVAFLLRPRG